MSLRPRQRLGKYEIVELLGVGGMGEVYRARDPELGRLLAVKVLTGLGAADARRRVLEEARLASSLDHPNVCTIYDVAEADGWPFIAMELVPGETLRARTGRGGLPVDSVVRYGAEIAAALAHAHGRGVVHGDLKSENVIVTPDGRPKLLDFSIASRVVRADVEETVQSTRAVEESGRIAGTLPYMAPEALGGAPASPQSDVWSLGIVLFEMATGALPFRGRTPFEIASAILREPVPPLPAGIPGTLARIIGRCLAKQPGERYQGAGEVQAALETIELRSSPGDAVIAQPSRVPRRLGARRLIAIAVLGVLIPLFAWIASRLTSTPRPASIAVLPLDNVSGDPAQDYIADGMTDALIAELGRSRDLHVTSRTSVMRFKDSKEPLRTIAQQLGVATVMEGSVLQAGGRTRVTARLIDAATDRTLWTQSYTRDVREILALQADVARAIVTELRGHLTAQEASRLAERRPIDPAVHETHLRARHQLSRRTEDSLTRAIELFRRVNDLDPTFAPGYAGLADAYLMLGTRAIGAIPPREAGREAKAAAARALELDRDLAEAHTSLGRAYFDEGRVREAETEYRLALQINPNLSTTRFWLAILLAVQERASQALDEVNAAYRLDPVAPIIVAGVAFINHLVRRHDDAMEYARRSLELDPDFPIGRMRLGVAYLNKRSYSPAIAELEAAVSASGRSPDMLGQLGHAYAVAGRPEDALRTLEELRELRRTHYVAFYNDALILTGLGRTDDAFASLDRALAEGDSGLVYLPVEPEMDPLRSDPRFAALLKRVGF